MRWLIDNYKEEGEEGECAGGDPVTLPTDFHVRRKKMHPDGSTRWGQAARTTSLIQPYGYKPSQRSLVKNLTDSAARHFLVK